MHVAFPLEFSYLTKNHCKYKSDGIIYENIKKKEAFLDN